MVERLNGIEEVRGSNPLGSTELQNLGRFNAAHQREASPGATIFCRDGNPSPDLPPRSGPKFPKDTFPFLV